MSAPRAVGGSHAVAEQGALAVLADGGGAIDGLIGGFFAAAGALPGVLLSPVGIIVGGVGVGARVFDGRALQPGKGHQRPRGLLDNAPTPEAARAAVPRSIAALSLLHAYGATQAWSALVHHGVAEAKKCGAKQRGDLLLAIGRGGSTALRTSGIARSMEQAAGPTAGGTLSETDVHEVLPSDGPPRIVALGDGIEAGLPPWSEPSDGLTEVSAQSHVIVCADRHGVVGALAFVHDDGGVELPSFQLSLPRGGEPVRRGIPRVKPGQPRSAPMALALVRRPADGWYASLGVSARGPIAPEEMASSTLREQLTALCGAPPSVALAASVQRRKTQLTRVVAGSE